MYNQNPLSNRNNRNNNWQENTCVNQRHVHEIQGSVQIADPPEEPHNHRFATVSGEAIGEGLAHYHEVRFRTDFFEDHFHEYCGKTSCAIIVGDRHVHFLRSVTSQNDCHVHEFRVATLIDNPIGGGC